MLRVSDKFYHKLIKKEKSLSKYFNQRTIVDDIPFDSKREAKRYTELKYLKKANVIRDLEIHPKFILQDTFYDNMGIKQRPVYYEADFSYEEKKTIVGRPRWVKIVEDIKGMKTEAYKLKKKLFLYKYPQYRLLET